MEGRGKKEWGKKSKDGVVESKGGKGGGRGGVKITALNQKDKNQGIEGNGQSRRTGKYIEGEKPSTRVSN